MNSRRLGFSLIEMLITIAIIAVLSGVGVSYYADYVEETKLATARSNIRAVKEAISRYFKDHMAYPNNFESLHGPYLMQDPVDLLLTPVSSDPNAKIQIFVYKGTDSAYNASRTDPNWAWEAYSSSNTHEFIDVRISSRGVHIK